MHQDQASSSRPPISGLRPEIKKEGMESNKEIRRVHDVVAGKLKGPSASVSYGGASAAGPSASVSHGGASSSGPSDSINDGGAAAAGLSLDDQWKLRWQLPEKERKRLKLLRNRELARKEYRRKRDYLEELEKKARHMRYLEFQVHKLERENDELQEKLSTVQNENEMLRQKALERCEDKTCSGPPKSSAGIEGISSSQPATQSQPSSPLPNHATTSPHFHSPNPHLPSFDATATTPLHPCCSPPSSHGGPPTYSYPPHNPPSPHPATDGPSVPTEAKPTTDGRILIEPDGDTFHPSKQPTHKIRDIIRSMYDAPYISWKKVQKKVRDMWFREFEKEFYWLPKHDDIIRKNFEKRGSMRMRVIFTDIKKSGKRPLWIGESIWIELTSAWGIPIYTERRDQKTSSGSNFTQAFQDSLYSQQVAALHADLKQVSKLQADWQVQIQMQTQIQQTQLLEEMRRIREQFNGKQPTSTEEDIDSD